MTTPFRNDADALRTRLHSLEEELHQLRAQAHELDSVKERLERVEKEHAAVREEVDARASGRSAPLLDSLKIASPCNESWDAMVGDARTRFCPKCEKNVHNLSEMARAEAEAFLQSVAGPVCVRMYKRFDGTVITADCPVGVKKKRVKRLFLATLGAGVAAAAGAIAFWRYEEATTMGEMEIGRPMGTVALPPEPPPTSTFATPPDHPVIQGALPSLRPEEKPKTTPSAPNKFATPPKPVR